MESTFRSFDQVGRGASIQTMELIQGELAGGLREIHSRFSGMLALQYSTIEIQRIAGPRRLGTPEDSRIRG